MAISNTPRFVDALSQSLAIISLPQTALSLVCYRALTSSRLLLMCIFLSKYRMNQINYGDTRAGDGVYKNYLYKFQKLSFGVAKGKLSRSKSLSFAV